VALQCPMFEKKRVSKTITNFNGSWCATLQAAQAGNGKVLEHIKFQRHKKVTFRKTTETPIAPKHILKMFRTCARWCNIQNTDRNRIIHDIESPDCECGNELFEKLRANGIQQDDYLREFKLKSEDSSESKETFIAYSSNDGGDFLTKKKFRSRGTSDGGQADKWQKKFCKVVDSQEVEMWFYSKRTISPFARHNSVRESSESDSSE